MNKKICQDTQSLDYINLLKFRIENVDLTWVSQFIGIIKSELGVGELSIKDIGCQTLQFYKQILKLKLPY